MAPGVVHDFPHSSKVCFSFFLFFFPFYSSLFTLPYHTYYNSQHIIISRVSWLSLKRAPHSSPLCTQIPENGCIGTDESGLSGRGRMQHHSSSPLLAFHLEPKRPAQESERRCQCAQQLWVMVVIAVELCLLATKPTRRLKTSAEANDQ